MSRTWYEHPEVDNAHITKFIRRSKQNPRKVLHEFASTFTDIWDILHREAQKKHPSLTIERPENYDNLDTWLTLYLPERRNYEDIKRR